jgi:hypothetical protein
MMVRKPAPGFVAHPGVAERIVPAPSAVVEVIDRRTGRLLISQKAVRGSCRRAERSAGRRLTVNLVCPDERGATGIDSSCWSATGGLWLLAPDRQDRKTETREVAS